MEKSLKSIKHTIIKYVKNGVLILLGTLAVAIVLQHILTFMLLTLLLGGMAYLSVRYNHVLCNLRYHNSVVDTY